MKQWTALAIAILLLIGCTSSLRFKDTPEGNQTAPNLDEAGSVHVAVLAVIPWNDIKAKMRPQIPIDTKTLRDQSIPVTVALLDRYLDVMRFQAALAPNTIKNTSTSVTEQETGKDDLVKTSSTTTRAPGEARATDTGTALAAGAAPAGTVTGASGINSSLTARAMASFVQDVQALNAEVDGAVGRTGYVPYLMRIQISVMPLRRHLGYDVYSNLSFFGYRGKFDEETGAAGKRTPNEGMPFIVPLISSDAIETAQRSQSIEALRDVGVALDLLKGFGAAGLSASVQQDRQQALQGLDVNSVLTMGRLSDNTLRVRLGAAFDPGGGYAVHPRTNTISVLVFFPKNANQTRVVARNSWAHILDGTVLDRSMESYEERLKPVAAQWKRLGLSVEELKQIDERALEGNFTAFSGKLDGILGKFCEDAPLKVNSSSKYSECLPANTKPKRHILLADDHATEKERSYAYIWAHLLSLLPGSRFSSTVVDLPRREVACPIAGQFVAYIENDKGFTVSLGGGKDLSSVLEGAVHWASIAAPATPTLAARQAAAAGKKQGGVKLAAAAPDASAKLIGGDSPSALMASDITISDDRKTATLSFAVNRIEPLGGAAGASLQPIAIELHGCGENARVSPLEPGLQRLWHKESQLYLVKARIPKKDDGDPKADLPDVLLSASTTNLVLIKKTAKAKVIVSLGEKNTKSFALKAVGADITPSPTAANITPRADGTYQVTASGSIDLSINNLSPNQSFDLELRPINEKNKLDAAVRTLSFTAR